MAMYGIVPFAYGHFDRKQGVRSAGWTEEEKRAMRARIPKGMGMLSLGALGGWQASEEGQRGLTLNPYTARGSASARRKGLANALAVLPSDNI